jgi:LysR family transcriptional regulator, nitrogen assimilation regulatory protein
VTSLRQIGSLVAVYEEGSFTLAAQHEGSTHSGISQHIKQLEIELEAVLFERSGREVAPTPSGKLYYGECAAVLKRLETAAARFAEMLEAERARAVYRMRTAGSRRRKHRIR